MCTVRQSFALAGKAFVLALAISAFGNMELQAAEDNGAAQTASTQAAANAQAAVTAQTAANAQAAVTQAAVAAETANQDLAAAQTVAAQAAVNAQAAAEQQALAQAAAEQAALEAQQAAEAAQQAALEAQQAALEAQAAAEQQALAQAAADQAALEVQQAQAVHAEALAVHAEAQAQLEAQQALIGANALVPELTPQNVAVTPGYRWTVAGEISEYDYQLLVALIYCEAVGEPFEGQVAVANVVFNRMRSSKFPNTLQEVVYQRGQFQPAYRLAGLVQRGGLPESCYRAADEAMAGSAPVGDAIFFMRKELHRTGQIIQNHIFWGTM